MLRLRQYISCLHEAFKKFRCLQGLYSKSGLQTFRLDGPQSTTTIPARRAAAEQSWGGSTTGMWVLELTKRMAYAWRGGLSPLAASAYSWQADIIEWGMSTNKCMRFQAVATWQAELTLCSSCRAESCSCSSKWASKKSISLLSQSALALRTSIFALAFCAFTILISCSTSCSRLLLIILQQNVDCDIQHAAVKATKSQEEQQSSGLLELDWTVKLWQGCRMLHQLATASNTWDL